MFFKSYKIKETLFKNRSVMAPMCMYQACEEGFVQPFHLMHYGSRAIGGVGLIIQEATAISKEGRISVNDLGIWDDKHISGLKQIADMIKSNGSLPGIQLNHAGRKAKGVDICLAPSAIPFSDEQKTPKEMSLEDIKKTIDDFKSAAKRAHLAGYDVLEIHAAHGYLIYQFLSPISNQRSDVYGDGVTYLKEVIKAVLEHWPKEKVLALRISATEYDPKGINVDVAANIINQVKHLGIDLIDISSGGNKLVSIPIYPGYQLKLAQMMKEKTNLPTIAGGLVTDLKLAEFALHEEMADFIFFGRVLLREPHFVLNHAQEIKHDIIWPKPYERGR